MDEITLKLVLPAILIALALGTPILIELVSTLRRRRRNRRRKPRKRIVIGTLQTAVVQQRPRPSRQITISGEQNVNKETEFEGNCLICGYPDCTRWFHSKCVRWVRRQGRRKCSCGSLLPTI